MTIDCAALTIKSGNAIVLRGSHYAERSNGALAAIVREALAEAGLPEDAVLLLAGGGHGDLAELATQEGVVDLLIPRGGEGLKAAIKDVATVPVMYAAAGNCHVYVHAEADLEMARRIAVNAKVQRPGVCNSAETLLIDAAIAERFAAGGPLRPAPRPGSSWSATSARARFAGEVEVGAATRPDWDAEYLDLKLAVAVVDSVEGAVEHVNRHGTGHSEAIVTSSRGGRRGVHRRGRRGRRLRQRLDPVHRRLRVRDGGRDRQLDPEAARPRPDRDARADHLQVRGPRRRPSA